MRAFRRDTDEVERRLLDAAVPMKAFMLLCQYNSDECRLDAIKETLTYYHSTEEPPLTVASYAERIMRHAEMGAEGVLIGLRLVGRCHRTSNVTLTRLSAHRLMIAAMTLGVKAHADRFRSNRTVAKAAGLQLRELNGLEYAFFREIGYRAVVTKEDFAHLQKYSAMAVHAAEVLNNMEEAVRLARFALLEEPSAALPVVRPVGKGQLPRSDSESSLQSLDDVDNEINSTYPAPTSANSESQQLAFSNLSERTAQEKKTPVRNGVRLTRFAAWQGNQGIDVHLSTSRNTMDAGANDVSMRSQCAGLTRFTSRAVAAWNPLNPPLDESSAFLDASPRLMTPQAPLCDSNVSIGRPL
jgi:hypothetical protein